MARADPGDGGLREGEVRGVVGLEDAKGGGEAPAGGDDEVGAEDLEPGQGATVGWREGGGVVGGGGGEGVGQWRWDLDCFFVVGVVLLRIPERVDWDICLEIRG